MSQKVVVELDAEEAKMVRAWQNGRKSIEEFASSITSIGPVSQQAESATKSLGAAASRWLKEVQSPFDAHMRRLGELQDLRQAGTLDEKQYAAGIAISVARMKEEEAAADKMGQTAKRVLAEQITPQQIFNAKLAELSELRKNNKLDEDQYATAVAKARAELESQDKRLVALKADAASLRSSLVTPQEEFARATAKANQMLHAEVISEAEYEMAVDQAKAALDAKDVALQQVLRNADQIKQRAVTPEQAHATAIDNAKVALEKKKITQQQYDAELKHQNDLLERSKQSQNAFGNSVLSTAGQFASQITGISGILGTAAAVVATLRSEYDSMIQRQQLAEDKQLDLAAAQEQAIQMLPADSKTTADELQQRLAKISQETGISQKDTNLDAANAFSSKNVRSEEDAYDAVRVSGKVNRFKADARQQFTGAILDIQNTFGGTAEEIAGFQLAALQGSRVTDAGQYAKNVVPGITAGKGFGLDLASSTALVNTLTQRMGDQRGAESATAMIQLLKRLNVELPHIADPIKQIEFVQSAAGDTLRKKMLGSGKAGDKGDLSVEANAYIPIRQLLSPGDNEAKNTLKAKMAETPDLAKGKVAYDTFQQRMGSSDVQAVAKLNMKSKAGVDALSIADKDAAITSAARRTLDEGLQAAGASYIERMVAARLFNIDDGTGLNTATNLLGNKADVIAQGKNGKPATAEELETATLLRAMVSEIHALRKDLANKPAAPKPAAPAAAPAINVNVKVNRPATDPTKTPNSAKLASGRAS